MVTSSLVSLFGIVEIGMALGMFLSGMIMLQVWSYFRNYSSDRLGLRCLVGLIQFVDILHSVVLFHVVYTYTIFFLMGPEGPATVIWSFKATVILLGINIAIVHSFFLMRVYTLTKSLVLFLISALLAAARLVIHVRQMVTVFTATDLEIKACPRSDVVYLEEGLVWKEYRL
ncbi:hypothetical protein EXIGLDRAFT_847203 [Exidia glandulosa HHB12029]|uniref:Uncharacterized protein n=1 Tax=Exidia glandulosa HHB12029 TaxID=1314781 RepID=A0A166N4L5_EXIGL|nr:hypothetical protein EXIGLDRAFT_847203 [Exidia glandulosa HHB12029]